MGRRERGRPFVFISRSSLPAVPFVTIFVADGVDCDIASNTITSAIKGAAVMLPAEIDDRADAAMTGTDDAAGQQADQSQRHSQRSFASRRSLRLHHSTGRTPLEIPVEATCSPWNVLGDLPGPHEDMECCLEMRWVLFDGCGKWVF